MTEQEKTAKVFKAFCDTNRITILELLQGGEKCACRLLEELHISQATLSHHMRILCDSGIVSGRREGKWMHYSIAPEGAEYAKYLIDKITAGTPGNYRQRCDK